MKVIINDSSGALEFILEDASGHDLTGRTVRDLTEADLLPDAKDAAKLRIDAARDGIAYAGCDTPSGRVDTTPSSISFITGASVGALIAQLSGQLFQITFIMQDNVALPLDSAAMQAIGVATMGHIDTLFSRARVLKDRIDAAQTLAAVATITWTLTDPLRPVVTH
jgi:hypothetical protein